jgi:hypothetical protein
VASIPKLLIPSSVKALDRLVGAVVDIPVAWLNQRKAKIDAQTQSYVAVESAIAQTAATEAGADHGLAERASNVLVRKCYRAQTNREAVSAAMLEDLRSGKESANSIPEDAVELIDDDWLNVFERYAEDASSDRMQKLWGRVLSGEIRKPGRFSMRTLRFLSEFSQADALIFENFCNSAFGGIAPNTLIKPGGQKDISHLLDLEASGLIIGASGLGLSQSIAFDSGGTGGLIEGNLAIVFKSEPNTVVDVGVVRLTPMANELISLLPGRDPRAAAKIMADSMRCLRLTEAFLSNILPNGQLLGVMEIIWQ